MQNFFCEKQLVM